MNLEIKKLSVDLIDNWLNFFDHIGFSDDGDWPGCYCMCYHWNNQLDKRYDWNNEVEKRNNAGNRKRAIKLIKEEIMHGYLAFYEGNVIGWCNANEKKKYDTVNFDFPWEDTEKNEKIKAIVCFCIAPKLRKKGIASQLLEKVCLDAAEDGYKFIEAYPFTNGENNNYHGSLGLYKKNGFKIYGKKHNCTIVRKYL